MPGSRAAKAVSAAMANNGRNPQAFITASPNAGATAVDMAIESPYIPNPSPMRLCGMMSVTQVEEALLEAAWNTPCAVRSITAVAMPADTK